MKPLKNKIIVRAAVDQKETLTYKSLKLFIPNRDKLNINGRESNPTLVEVVSAGDNEHVKPGDYLILGHNSISNDSYKIDEHDGVRTLVLPIDRWILGKLDDLGNLVPLYENLVVERIYAAPVSSIIITPDAYRTHEQNKVNILATAPDVKHLFPGQTAVIHKYADYEIFYTVDGVERSAVVTWAKDVLGVVREEVEN